MKKDIRKLKITKEPGPNTININDITIDEKIIKGLNLTTPMTREQRRNIARKAKIKWEIYKVLEREIMRRMKNNLNLVTGKSPTNTDNRKESNETEEQ